MPCEIFHAWAVWSWSRADIRARKDGTVSKIQFDRTELEREEEWRIMYSRRDWS
jgi:hypothetical protein